MKRIIRLTIFGVLALAVALGTLNIGLAWIVVTSMTHPSCSTPTPLTGYPFPEEHWLAVADGRQIRVWYYPSRNGAAILMFGGMGGALGNQLPPAAFLLNAGYGVLQVDTRACARPPAPVTQGYNERYDAEAALDFLLSRPEVASDRIGAMGFSMGGATALRVTAARPEIRGVVRDGGFTNLGALLSPSDDDPMAIRIHKNTILMLYRLRSGIDPWALSPIDDLKTLRTRPVLLIYGEHEAAAGLMQKQVGGDNVMLWIVPGGTHGRNHLAAPDEYQQRVLDFFEKALR